MKTRINNISGGDLYCGWLPPHGRTLTESESLVIEGDLRTILASGSPSGRYSRKTQIAGLNQAIADGDIELITIEGEEESSNNA